MELTEKQMEYVREAHRRWNIAEGAVRSGKSWLATTYTIPDRVTSLAGKRGIDLILGVSLGNIERNVLLPMRERYGSALVGEIRGMDNAATVFGEKVYCIGAEKKNQTAKLKGSEVKFCYCDELADISEDVFEMLKSRLSLPYSECHAACNPASPSHWLKRFLDTPGLDVYDQHYTIEDNPHLPAEYVDELKKEYAGTVWYDRYIKGEWTLAEGLVYQFPRESIEEDAELLDGEVCWCSIDYGITNPFAALLWTVRDGTAVCVDEWGFDSRREGRRLTDQELYDGLRAFLRGRNVESVVIDPSATSFREVIDREGEWWCVPAKNSVTDGIQLVSRAMGAGQLKIAPRCAGLWSELGAYHWDGKRPDHVVKETDHYCDAMRYFVATVGRDYIGCLA